MRYALLVAVRQKFRRGRGGDADNILRSSGSFRQVVDTLRVGHSREGKRRAEGRRVDFTTTSTQSLATTLASVTPACDTDSLVDLSEDALWLVFVACAVPGNEDAIIERAELHGTRESARQRASETISEAASDTDASDGFDNIFSSTVIGASDEALSLTRHFRPLEAFGTATISDVPATVSGVIESTVTAEAETTVTAVIVRGK